MKKDSSFNGTSYCTYDIGDNHKEQLGRAPHSSYSPDLAPADYPLLGVPKDQMKSQHYKNDSAVRNSMHGWL